MEKPARALLDLEAAERQPARADRFWNDLPVACRSAKNLMESARFHGRMLARIEATSTARLLGESRRVGHIEWPLPVRDGSRGWKGGV